MSDLARWSYAEGPVTLWPLTGTDSYGQPVYDDAILIETCDYITGGDVRRDANGDEFAPKLTAWFELEPDSNPAPDLGWLLALGDYSTDSGPPDAAEQVRAVRQFPMGKFGAGQIPDWEVIC